MTSDEARAALREKVARAIYEHTGGTKWDVLGEEGTKEDYRIEADAAIAVVLEEAARVAEPKRKPCDCVEQTPDGTWFCDCGCTNSGDFANAMAWCNDANIAVAIRAMIGKD